MKAHWNQFDGLRVFAIIVIIASHTAAFGLYGQGSVIVSLFFVLSGFFATKPLKENGEEEFTGFYGFLRYYILRCTRILPVFWMVVLFFYWVSDTAMGDKRALLANLTLYNVYGHLWYLQHLMVCYFLAPFILLLIHWAKKKLEVPNWMVAVGLFVLGTGLSYYLFRTAHFCLLWNGEKRQLRLGLFVIGMAIGYVAKALKGEYVTNYVLKILMDVLAFGLMLSLSFLTSASFLSRFNEAFAQYYIGWYKPIFCTMLSAALVFLLVVNSDGYLSRFLGLPVFKTLGDVTLGVYLIHFFLIEFFVLTPTKRFVMVTLVSYALAYCSHLWLEKPLNQWVRRLVEQKINRL